MVDFSMDASLRGTSYVKNVSHIDDTPSTNFSPSSIFSTPRTITSFPTNINKPSSLDPTLIVLLFLPKKQIYLQCVTPPSIVAYHSLALSPSRS